MCNNASVSLHSYKIMAKGIKKKIIYHFSDVHLTEYDALSDAQEKTEAIKQTRYWEDMRCDFAKKHGEEYKDANRQSTHTHFCNLIDAAGDGDALVLTGDIFDYINGANLRTAEKELKKLSPPFLWAIGNHENADEIPESLVFSDVKKSVQILEFDDMNIFCIDDSNREIKDEQNAQLKSVLKSGKLVLIAMHVPIMTAGNTALLEECGEYFRLNHPNASPQVYEFIDIIKQNSEQIVAVLAGHLHFANNTEITEGVMQYVSTQGALGNINRYEIGE